MMMTIDKAAVCDDDNDGCRFGQMQLTNKLVQQQINGHAPWSHINFTFLIASTNTNTKEKRKKYKLKLQKYK